MKVYILAFFDGYYFGGGEGDDGFYKVVKIFTNKSKAKKEAARLNKENKHNNFQWYKVIEMKVTD